MSKKKWEEYKIGTPSSRPEWTEPTCQPFKEVHNIAHLGDALRIIEDGKIRSSLIWDESCLNNTRTCVSWLSPNRWGGSIYGNIQFNYDWNNIIRGRKLYWVEAIEYNPPAYRILITDSDCSSLNLEPYDPTIGDGPVYHDINSGVWYRNGDFTGEFLIDRDLPLEECIKIEFIDHHKTMCKKDGSSCMYLKSYTPKVGAQFLSSVVARDLHLARRLLAEVENGDVLDIYSSTREAINYLLMKLGDSGETGEIKTLSLGDKALAKAIYNAYAIGDDNQANILANILKQSCSVKIPLVQILEEFFGESIWELLSDDI